LRIILNHFYKKKGNHMALIMVSTAVMIFSVVIGVFVALMLGKNQNTRPNRIQALEERVEALEKKLEDDRYY